MGALEDGPGEGAGSPDGGFVGGHEALDDRLAAAFRRYDQAFQTRRRTPPAQLVAARLDLSLLLWEDGEVPDPVRDQLASDGAILLRDTPPL
jgi:hypothetical protein